MVGEDQEEAVHAELVEDAVDAVDAVAVVVGVNNTLINQHCQQTVSYTHLTLPTTPYV